MNSFNPQNFQQRGFTLIELMVVLVIIGIASAAISLSIKPDPLHVLRKDADRVAQLLQVAQAEARADGRPIFWRADAKGFRFSRRNDNGEGVDRFQNDPLLRPRRWETPGMEVSLAKPVVLSAEWINPPLQLRLSDGVSSITVQRSATGVLSVQ